MKVWKSVLIYGVIILLCAIVAVGYFTSDKVSGKNSDANASAVAPSTASTSAAASGITGSGSETENPAADVAVADSNGAVILDAAGANSASGNVSDKQAHIKELMAKAAAEPDANPVVGVGRGKDYTKVTEDAVQNAGGLDQIVKKGDLVLIKPNICTYAEAGSPKITDYRTVGKISEMVRKLGASRVIVAEGTISGNAFSENFLRVNKYDTIKGVELLDLNSFQEADCYELSPEKSLTGKKLFIPRIYMDADVVINVAKLKTHSLSEAIASLTLKNSYGVPPGQIYGLGSKNGLHTLGLTESVIDLNRIRRPDFFVIEGIVGGEGFGPLDNTPVESDIIFAGKDPVALDSVGFTFMGIDPEISRIVTRAAEEKLGTSDLKKIRVVGADMESIKMKFSMY